MPAAGVAAAPAAVAAAPAAVAPAVAAAAAPATAAAAAGTACCPRSGLGGSHVFEMFQNDFSTSDHKFRDDQVFS